MPDQETISSKRRILVHTPEPGVGAGQYVAEWVKALAQVQPDVTLICPENFAYAAEVLASGAQIIGTPLRDIRRAGLWRRLTRNLAFLFATLLILFRTVRSSDIVHFQFAPSLGRALLLFLAARLRGASIVLTVHDPVPHRWLLPGGLRWVEQLLLRWEYALCDRIIVHNDAGRDVLTRHYRANPATVAVIPHGPLHAAQQPGAQPPHAGPLRLLMFGSLRENKGLHLAIDAVQALNRRLPEGELSLTIAGAVPNSGEQPYWTGCKRRIAQAPRGITVFERTIPDEEVPALFAGHHAVLLPYMDFYSDSGVAMLALAQQRPLIATGAGGLNTLLRESNCGISIAAPTPESVETAILSALSLSPAALHGKGLNGYAYTKSERSWASIAARTVDLYCELSSARNKLRVVIHTPEPMPSASLYVEELAQALAEPDLDLKLVAPANHQSRAALEANPYIRFCPCAERLTIPGSGLFAKVAANLRFLASSTWTLLRQAERRGIVHFQYILHPPFGLIFFFCAWVKRNRIVFTVHDPLPHKWLLPRSFQRLEKASLALAYRLSDSLIVHSEAGRQTLLKVFGVPVEKISVVVHGPYRLKTELPEAKKSDQLEVLLFGSFRENKGMHLAIEAFQQLEREGVKARLTIAGAVVNRKETAYWEACRAKIAPMGGSIRLIERFILDEELPELFAGSDCFLLPYTSFFSDSGVATIALSNGKPIIATAAGGLGWLLDFSGAGILIEDHSSAAVAAAIRKAVSAGRPVLERMGQTGSSWVMAACSWPVVAKETRGIYAHEWTRVHG